MFNVACVNMLTVGRRDGHGDAFTRVFVEGEFTGGHTPSHNHS